MTPEDIDMLYGTTWFQQGGAMRRPPKPTPDLVYLFARNVEKFVLQSLTQPAQAAVPEWISVHDRLPEVKITDDSVCILAGRPIPPSLNSERVKVAYLHQETQKYRVSIDYLTGLQGRGPCWWNQYGLAVHFWLPLNAAPKREGGVW